MRGMGYQKPVALLTAVLESGQPKQVENAAWMLSYFRTNAESSVPNLLAVLSDERLKNAFFPSIEALGAIAPGSRHATNVATRLGALLEEKSYWPLKEESIATTLGKLGADAFSTLPVLDSFIGDGLSEKRHTGSLEKRQIVIAIGEIAQAGHSRGLTYNPMKLTEIFKDDYAALSLHKQTAEVFSTVFPDFLKTFPQIANRVEHLLKL